MNTENVTAAELRQFIERYERLESEKKDIAETQKETMAEAKGRGYDAKRLPKQVNVAREIDAALGWGNGGISDARQGRYRRRRGGAGNVYVSVGHVNG